MTVRRKAAGTALIGVAPLALTVLTAVPAAAHGSMTDPVSRVSACFAENPESPDSAACKAAVAASGTQAFYDWNEVNIPNAAGKHQEIIPDGKLCSAGRDKYKGLDLPRADWPATALSAGKHTFHYKATAPHKGSFELYITKAGYDPTKPLKWSDLEAEPFAEVTDPSLVNGEYVFDGTVPARSGRHLVYSVWQRSDSPEAFYTCSDVTFGGSAASGAGAGADGGPEAAAPDDDQIEAAAGKSTVSHGGHGGDEHPAGDADKPVTQAAPADGADADDTADDADGTGNAPTADGASGPAAGAEQAGAGTEELAQTGGDSSTTPLAVGGSAVVALGAAVLLASARRRAVRRRG
ncbi:lytic polysaccharide monooxygenase [Streptomyces sp. S07_1.15]|uniref:lytic polysaccharide monooxygenase auxiliary activity family 9 protein n=1 Tax=Streptomyces sp. S07_1.15 TaxID=2873925 RepID=UPI001D15BE1F|nr:lytic polysaccharide monooxygenase [Streptomyces sp. S07_1.15]MCC3654956.1 lytic polysaccharide monooxygenase [Streptomyces sp. S07_1.15]